MHMKKTISDPINSNIQFSWSSVDNEAEAIARFFVDNTGTAYISHTDIQWGRAASSDCWSPSLHSKIADLAAEAAKNRQAHQTASGIWLAKVMQNTGLLGIAFVTLRQNAATPFVILEDLIIRRDTRSHGIGSSLISWICQECHSLGFHQIFLESAIGNERAHALFRRQGFETLSVVMSRNI